MLDKGKAAAVTTIVETKDANSGKVIFESQSTVFVRGAGGFGGKRAGKGVYLSPVSSSDSDSSASDWMFCLSLLKQTGVRLRHLMLPPNAPLMLSLKRKRVHHRPRSTGELFILVFRLHYAGPSLHPTLSTNELLKRTHTCPF